MPGFTCLDCQRKSLLVNAPRYLQEYNNLTAQRDKALALQAPTIETLEDAQFWIGVLHRRSVFDIEQINKLREEMSRTWWKRFAIKHGWRRYAA
jgi:hypothetical protein